MGGLFQIRGIAALFGCGAHGECAAFDNNHIKGYAIDGERNGLRRSVKPIVERQHSRYKKYYNTKVKSFHIKMSYI